MSKDVIIKEEEEASEDETVSYIHIFKNQPNNYQPPPAYAAEPTMIDWHKQHQKYRRQCQREVEMALQNDPDTSAGPSTRKRKRVDMEQATFAFRTVKDHFDITVWHSNTELPLPERLTLEELARDYPNHLYGEYLLRFMNDTSRKWTAKRIYKLLDPVAQAEKASLKGPESWIAKRMRYLDPVKRTRESANNKRLKRSKKGERKSSQLEKDDEVTEARVRKERETLSEEERVEDYTLEVFNDPNWSIFQPDHEESMDGGE